MGDVCTAAIGIQSSCERRPLRIIVVYDKHGDRWVDRIKYTVCP